jgi:DNA-binding NarL/FixJ family response regulator
MSDRRSCRNRVAFGSLNDDGLSSVGPATTTMRNPADHPAIDSDRDQLESSRCVLILGKSPIVQMGLRALMLSRGWIVRCVSTRNSTDALAMARQCRPDLALFDSPAFEDRDVDLCRVLAEVVPSIAVVVMCEGGLSVGDRPRPVSNTQFVARDSTPDRLLAVIGRATGCAPSHDQGSLSTLVGRLSVRQLDVLREIARGSSNLEAARNLYLSPHTVKQHTHTIYTKLGVRNRVEAVCEAQRIGILS